jgi:thiopeptide-type bacteriocin biosynthesis protein
MTRTAGATATCTPIGFFVLRTPYLPASTLLADDLSGDGPPTVEDAAGGGTPLQALAGARRRSRQRLAQLAGRPDVHEALRIASPGFGERVDRWRREPDGEDGRRVGRALLSYLLRMSTRPTPFGLFAGFSVGRIGDRAPVSLSGPGQAHFRRHVRLDVICLRSLTDRLQQAPPLRERLRYFPSSSAYRLRDQVRYVEARTTPAGRTHHLVTVDADEPLLAVLGLAATGARLEELASGVVAAAPTICTEQARRYVEELVDAQLLQSELEPAVTGPDPLETTVDRLVALGDVASFAGTALARVQQDLALLDGTAPGCAPEAYARIEADLRSLGVDLHHRSPVRVVLVKPAPDLTLPTSVTDEMARGIDLLHAVGGATRPDALAAFREAFRQRYGGAREVDLCEVLDDDAGIGFSTWGATSAGAAPVLEGLTFPPEHPPAPVFGAREALLLRWLVRAERTGADEIVLGDDEVDSLRAADPRPRAPLPDALSVLATVLAPDAPAVARGDYRVLIRAASGPSGANLLGRLCGSDPELTRHVRGLLRAEEAADPEAVFAEIVHVPEDRIADVMVRPRLRSFEIPYPGRSSASPEQQLPVADLAVSVVADRVLLTSRRLGRRVVPRLSTAHDFTGARNLPLYQFLCALQDQDVAGGLHFSFGALSIAPYLPRVVAGRLVLSRARWNLTSAELVPLREQSDDARHLAAQRLRQELRLPRVVSLEDGDTLLPIDLADPCGLDLLIDRTRERNTVALVESFLDRRDLLPHGPTGGFVHDLVVPFVRVPSPPGAPPEHSPRSRPVARARRRRPPGSEWLFTKLYCGPISGDAVLRDLVAPVVERAVRRSAVDRWFFVRYADPQEHLRVRMRGDPARLRAEVLPALEAGTAPLLGAGVLWRVQLDTYEREIERYGGVVAAALSERVFRADSDAVLAVVQSAVGDPAADVRWRLALLGIDRLLDDLGLDLPAKQALVQAARDGFAREMAVDDQLRRELGRRFRAERPALERLLVDGAPALSLGLGHEVQVWNRRSTTLRPVVHALRRLERAGKLSTSWEALAGSYVHMHVNRMLCGPVRAQELVLHDFLNRLYRGQLARR